MAVLVTTVENSGIDRYSQELAKRLGVPTVQTRRYLSPGDTFHLLRRLKQNPSPVHFPSQHFARYGLFLRKPFIVTVHDLVRICFPFGKETIQEKIGLRLDALGLKRAEHIIAASASTKRDLVRYLRVPEDRVTVIYNGVDRKIFKPVSRRRFGFPYLLYVGSERPRKNLSTLLAAFAQLKSEASAFGDLRLIKVGAAGRTAEFRQATLHEVKRLGLEGEVIFTEYVSDDDLAGYYSSAIALVVPSLYEGFGLPLIEAMACGCPVVASNSSSLPEVADNAALFFDPYSSEELARKLRRVITEPDLRHQLAGKGLERAELFSWGRAARETLLVYLNVEAELGQRQLRHGARLPGY
jgi:glycosyltransferase involved in cell wall biosynthesis